MPFTVDDVKIANLALSAVGTRSSISSFTEGSAESDEIGRQYEFARAEMLRAAHWDFARKQTSLNLLADATVVGQTVPQPWLYEYAVPPDSVGLRYIMPSFDAIPGSVPGTVSSPYFTGPPVRFLMSSDSDASGNDILVILTNQANAQVVYTKLITNPNLWDALYIRAFSLYLGHCICNALTGSAGKSKQLYDESSAMVNVARARNGNEGSLTVDDHVPDWIRARGYASDWAYPPGSIGLYAPQNLTLVS